MPAVWTFQPLACVVTAKRMMAPAAIKTRLTTNPMTDFYSMVLPQQPVVDGVPGVTPVQTRDRG